MDLRDMLNDGGPGASSQVKPRPPHPPSLSQPPQPQHPAPVLATPTQAGPQQSFHDYSHTTQASPTIRHLVQEYSAQSLGHANFKSPLYPPGLAYPSRAVTQPATPGDVRSPSIGVGPVASPRYRPTSTSSISGPSAAYSFPTAHSGPASPGQRYQYPLGYAGEPYSQYSTAAVSIVGIPGAISYSQSQVQLQPHLPPTPPVASGGLVHAYLQHRTSSTHSLSPTPHSLHSQTAQYSAAYAHASPNVMTRPPPLDARNRQASQPPAPLGSLIPPQRSAIAGYPQPISPHQNRMPMGSSCQRSPPQGAQSSLPNPPSSQTAHETQVDEASRLSRTRSERERSESVSPRTRVSTVKSSVGHRTAFHPDTDSRTMHPTPGSAATPLPSSDLDRRTPAGSNAVAHVGKRKLEEIGLQPHEMEKRDSRRPTFEKADRVQPHNRHGPTVANRAAQPAPAKETVSLKTESKVKMPKRYEKPPVWSEEQGGRDLKNRNFVLHKPVNNYTNQLNGKHPEERKSGQAPESHRTSAPDAKAAPSRGFKASPTPELELPNQGNPLGPWEQNLLGQPLERELTKAVADFLYVHVVGNRDMGEIRSRNVQIEVEAKLGKIIDRNTNQRIHLPVSTECLLENNSMMAFRSTMTAAQHKRYNELLNQYTAESHRCHKTRVAINFKHTKERDKFYEIPLQMRRQLLPACVQNYIPAKRSAKVRVTYNQVNNEVLAKIVKARIADLHIHMPRSQLDCRISVSLEMPWDGAVEELEQMPANASRDSSPDRIKDRCTYKQRQYQVDLTQVITTTASGPNKGKTEMEHELEVELSTAAILDQGTRAQRKEKHQYMELVEGLLDNVRLLARTAGDI